MFEKVNPAHPDKIADRIAGALVDMAYSKEQDPKIAVEVLIGHGECHIIAETSVKLNPLAVDGVVKRISGVPGILTDYTEVEQDANLADNQRHGPHCGDNGIFKGMPVTEEQKRLSKIVREIYEKHPYDGKYILAGDEFIGCQSNVEEEELWNEFKEIKTFPNGTINPLGYWTGGINVDSGATNRKLGSDMGDAVTGGGLHGKDLSKADVSLNIYAHLMAQKLGRPVYYVCAIGDGTVDGVPYRAIVREARSYIRSVGGFEKFAEWGLI